MTKKMFSLIALLFAFSLHAEVSWYTDYDQAVSASKSSSKPIVMLFTGSDWCPLCIKLEREILSTPDFAQAAGDKFVFLKLDFPLDKNVPQKQADQNKRLQQQFNIQGYPTIVILDPSLKKIATASYRPGGGKQFADYLMQLIQNHQAYLKKTESLNHSQLAGCDLKELYEKAVELNDSQVAEKVIQQGSQSEESDFFLLEHYRNLADKGLNQSPEALKVRNTLIAQDPNNEKQNYYQIAVIDFEASCKKNNIPADRTVASLVDYIQKFGQNDRDHLWRLQMLISQVYFDKDDLQEALQYAKSSYQSAPSAAQSEIAMAIKNIESKLKP